ncbi:MAG: hypothetical protein ABH844_02795 [Candidatus Omnitrophota bacterium]
MKGMLQIAGTSDIKSIHSIGTGSIPKIQRSGYLELYILRREKDRLEKEVFGLSKRKDRAEKQLDEILKRIENSQEETSQEKKVKPSVKLTTKPLKTFSLSY